MDIEHLPQCIFDQATPGHFVCVNCGQPTMPRIHYDEAPRRNCFGPPGPGHHLKCILLQLKITPGANCECDHHAAKMDRKGPDWCEENIATIVGWMQEAAAKRTAAQRTARPFIKAGARALVLLAIRRARRDAAKVEP